MENSAYEKIAKILRVDKHVIADLETQMSRATGKMYVLEAIVEENDALVHDRMQRLGIPRESRAREVYDALISKIEADDLKIFTAAGIVSARGYEAAQKICAFATRIASPGKGFFLKLEKARALLVAAPPKNILAALGYTNVLEMLAHEDILEIYSALRFLESTEWQHTVFFKQYERLTPADFEERPIVVRALPDKWAAAAEKFVAKKYHNVSHLKELGVIFVIPIFLGISGETLRILSLLLHYFHEVQYYAGLFRQFAHDEQSLFALRIISLLRGDVVEQQLSVYVPEAMRFRWLIVQRYLAKDDENDWRLFAPHINPEAMHWERAMSDILGGEYLIPNFHDGLDFWKDLGWVGDYFQTEVGVPVLVSFNLVDTVMSLVKEKELIKYLYHHEEALWNRIFTGYFSEAELENFSKKYILQGWLEV